MGPSGQGATAGERHGPLIDIVSIVLFLVVWSLGMAIEILKQWRITQKQIAMAEADKANAELSFLKSQINPHFLFNTLNNIYSLASTKSEKAPEAVMMLSNIMRYMTDEVSRDFVPLQWELDCAGNYIELQKLRLTDKVKVDFLVEGNAADKRIAPLLLMTFIENVFKYGISSREKCSINMSLIIEEDKITFYSKNKIFQIIGHPRTGIGIANTKKRLEHLYPGKHKLLISNEHELFNVELVIHL
jgi:LytS/YehU family sensor histidine kinase